MSIIGMIPVAAPGTLVHFSNPDDATTAIGINPDSPSYYITFTFSSSCNAADQQRRMLKVRDAVLDYQAEQIKMLAVIDTALSRAISKLSAIDSGLVPKSSDHAVRQKAQEAISQLFEEYLKEIAEARARVSKAEAEVTKRVNYPNLIFSHWSSTTDSAASIELQNVGTTNARSRASVDGYWILGGLRVRFLVIGGDIQELVGGRQHKPSSPEARKMLVDLLGEVSVTTFAMQSQDSLWVSESSELLLIEQKVTANVEQLMNLFIRSGINVALLQQIRAEAEVAAARRSNLSNIGMLARPTWQLVRHYWNASSSESELFRQKVPDRQEAVEKLQEHRLKGADEWMTIMAQSAAMGSAAGDLLDVLAQFTLDSKESTQGESASKRGADKQPQ